MKLVFVLLLCLSSPFYQAIAFKAHLNVYRNMIRRGQTSSTLFKDSLAILQTFLSASEFSAVSAELASHDTLNNFIQQTSSDSSISLSFRDVSVQLSLNSVVATIHTKCYRMLNTDTSPLPAPEQIFSSETLSKLEDSSTFPSSDSHDVTLKNIEFHTQNQECRTLTPPPSSAMFGKGETILSNLLTSNPSPILFLMLALFPTLSAADTISESNTNISLLPLIGACLILLFLCTCTAATCRYFSQRRRATPSPPLASEEVEVTATSSSVLHSMSSPLDSSRHSKKQRYSPGTVEEESDEAPKRMYSGDYSEFRNILNEELEEIPL